MESSVKNNELIATIKGLWLSVSHILSEMSTIVKLETRLASVSLFAIILMLFISSFLCLAVYLCGVSAFCVWMLQLGYSWPLVLAGAGGINLALLIMLGLAIRRCSKNLFFKATRNQFCRQPLGGKELVDVQSAQEPNPIA